MIADVVAWGADRVGRLQVQRQKESCSTRRIWKIAEYVYARYASLVWLVCDDAMGFCESEKVALALVNSTLQTSTLRLALEDRAVSFRGIQWRSYGHSPPDNRQEAVACHSYLLYTHASNHTEAEYRSLTLSEIAPDQPQTTIIHH